MLTKQTVLILGAGASAPFSFPTGIELSKRLVSGLADGQLAHKDLMEHGGYSHQDIEKFRISFFESGRNSVDAFLETRQEYIEIGKSALAVLLIRYETNLKLLQYEDNWLRHLYNNFGNSFEKFGDNRISVVTFNYDRTVEHFFFTSLKNSYGRTDEECKFELEKIPVIHLHGQLGPLPWQATDSRPYNQIVDQNTLKLAAQGIKIVHEDITDGRDKDFERAKTLIRAAPQILIMGFGYNLTNMDRLGLKHLGENRAVGTSVGLGNHEKANIRLACNKSVSFVTDDCITFMRERLRWT